MQYSAHAECEIIHFVNCEILLSSVAMWNEINPLTRRSAFHKSRKGFISLKKATKKRKGSTPHKAKLIHNGGTDGNWTRVRRPLDITFSVGSQSIEIPASGCRVTGFRQGSFLMRDRYRSNSRFTCTTNLTHGLGRSPPKRYGRLMPQHAAYAATANLLLSFII